MAVIEPQVPSTAAGAEELLEEDFSDLADEVQAFIRRFVYLPDDEALVLAIWAIHTWPKALPVWYTTPYLYVHGAKESGKTRLLSTLAQLVWNPHIKVHVTQRTLFERIEREKGAITIMLDEADLMWRGYTNAPLLAVFDSGYKRGATIDRMVNGDMKEYEVFCPKILSGIYNGKLPAQLEDRTIPITMKRKPPEVELERFKEQRVEREPDRIELVDRIARFTELYWPTFAGYIDVIEAAKALSDRQNEVIEPLLVVAGVLGLEVQLRDALTRIFRQRDATISAEQEVRVVLLTRVRKAFGSEERLSTEQLCSLLGLPWDGPQPGAGRRLAQALLQFGVTPKDIRFGNRSLKGYEREAFEPAFDRYLEPDYSTDTD